MEAFLLRAKAFAEETAKRSQELLSEGAKYTQEIAKETAKQTEILAQETAKQTRVLAQVTVNHTKSLNFDSKSIRDFANETVKKAEIGFKALVDELKHQGNEENGTNSQELEEYGVTSDLREFVKGLTLRTFRDFPLEDVENMKRKEREDSGSCPVDPTSAVTNVVIDLNPWQEHHALLVLKTVKEISDFRYALCPQRMTEHKFWKIYFLLVHSHLQPFQERAKEKAKKEKMESEKTEKARKDQEVNISEASESSTANIALLQEKNIFPPDSTSAPSASNSDSYPTQHDKESPNVGVDNDLDAYLMGESDDSGGEFEEDEFDKLVNDAGDSDSEDKADKTLDK